MKGKNAGKRFHRRSRRQLAPPRLNVGERTIILRRDLNKSQREYHYGDEEHAELNSIMDYPSNAILTGLPIIITKPSMEIMNECEALTFMAISQSLLLISDTRLFPYNEQIVSPSSMAFYGRG